MAWLGLEIKKAQQILPFTKSVDFAAAKMTKLKAKGNTFNGNQACSKYENEKYPEDMHIIVPFTDGKSNYDILAENTKLVVNAAEQVKKAKYQCL